MQALDRGIVSLEDPVTKFYNQANPPVFGPHNPYSSDLSGVTLHSLAQHSSGLSREVPQPTVNMSDAEAPIIERMSGSFWRSAEIGPA